MHKSVLLVLGGLWGSPRQEAATIPRLGRLVRAVAQWSPVRRPAKAPRPRSIEVGSGVGTLTVEDLKGASLEELEAIYKTSPRGATPIGTFKTDVLYRIDNPEANSLHARAIEWFGWSFLNNGIQFKSANEGTWWFGKPWLKFGAFKATPGPSMWRETETLGLRYDLSKFLYDEVKPLTNDLCLGIAGMNAKKGVGDHFYFALKRMP